MMINETFPPMTHQANEDKYNQTKQQANNRLNEIDRFNQMTQQAKLININK